MNYFNNKYQKTLYFKGFFGSIGNDHFNRIGTWQIISNMLY